MVRRCSLCDTQFSMFRRKHHCRVCGKVVCGSCSTSRLAIRTELQRVCDPCASVAATCCNCGAANDSHSRTCEVCGTSACRLCKKDIMERMAKLRWVCKKHLRHHSVRHAAHRSNRSRFGAGSGDNSAAAAVALEHHGKTGRVPSAKELAAKSQADLAASRAVVGELHIGLDATAPSARHIRSPTHRSPYERNFSKFLDAPVRAPQTSLRMVVVVHRHGARFPNKCVASDLSWPQCPQFWEVDDSP